MGRYNPFLKRAASPKHELVHPTRIIQVPGQHQVTYSQVTACVERSNCQVSSKSRQQWTYPRVSCESRSKVFK